MQANKEPTIDELRDLARRAGLELTDDELRSVLPGVVRNLAMAETARKWAAGAEPQVGSLAPRA